MLEDQPHIGKTISHYRILEKLGAGGMGVVFKAEDAKLGRFVALKFLPDEVADDPQTLSRFQREAKVLASLNHPNIATIHGLEDSGATHALVMELVTGPTLADRIALGPIPIEEALLIAKQITDALEYAHERGIVHRDLKPANVKVTVEDAVKVLDFGLAKALQGDAATADISSSPTITRMQTHVGVLLGTPAYMSPEQARGKPVDRRADIWAFGCVLYEMLTGKMAFRGESVTDTLAVVMRDDPDLSLLPAATPARVRVLLQRCLRKDPKQRLRDIGDARISLDEVLSGAPEVVPGASAAAALASKSLGVRQWMLVLGALLLGAITTAFAIWNLKPASPDLLRPVIRTTINLPTGQQLAGLDDGPAIALSRDGSQLAYVASQNGTQEIYLRPLNTSESKAIPGTEDGVNPFFSSDGQWLGFFSNGKLKKISLGGGVAINLDDALKPSGASWSSQGFIGFAPKGIGALEQIRDGGGASQPLTRLQNTEFSHRWPDFLPDGRTVIFSAGSPAASWSNAQIGVETLGGGSWTSVSQGGTNPRYASTGHLIYAQDGTLMAVPFDEQKLIVSGTAIPMVEGVHQSLSSGASQYSFSTTGSLAYVSGTLRSTESTMVWVDRNGKEQATGTPAHPYRELRISPDGQQVAVQQESQLWLFNFEHQTFRRFSFDGSTNSAPAWTPDRKRIAYQSAQQGSPQPNLFLQMADGSGGPERLTTSEHRQAASSWSPDGQLLAYIEINPSTGFDIWILRISDKKSTPFLQTAYNESAPRFSPNGKWIAYVSDESGRFEIYVQPYPGPGGKWQISSDGGTEPVWNPDGKELFYRSGDKLMSADISEQPGFSASKPRTLFQGNYVVSPVTFPNYDVSPDGKRFLMLKPNAQAQAPQTEINLVTNWFEELKKRAPTGKQ